MAYVVRDRRSLGRLLLGGALSVVVVVAICAVSGRWQIALVGIPLSGVGLWQRIQRETTLLRADHDGLSLGNGSMPWADIDEIEVTPASVRVTLGQQAPPAPGTRGVVTRPGDASSRQVWCGSLRGDPQAHVSGIREVAPARFGMSDVVRTGQ